MNFKIFLLIFLVVKDRAGFEVKRRFMPTINIKYFKHKKPRGFTVYCIIKRFSKYLLYYGLEITKNNIINTDYR